MYLGLVHGSDHCRTRTWPFWTKPMVWSKVHHNQWTEPIVQFGVLQNPFKNQTEPNLTIPTWLVVDVLQMFSYSCCQEVSRWGVGRRFVHVRYMWWFWQRWAMLTGLFSASEAHWLLQVFFICQLCQLPSLLHDYLKLRVVHCECLDCCSKRESRISITM